MFTMSVQGQDQEGFGVGLAMSLRLSPGRPSQTCCCEKLMVLVLTSSLLLTCGTPAVGVCLDESVSFFGSACRMFVCV